MECEVSSVKLEVQSSVERVGCGACGMWSVWGEERREERNVFLNFVTF